MTARLMVYSCTYNAIWRAFQAQNSLKCSPMLDFGKNYGRRQQV